VRGWGGRVGGLGGGRDGSEEGKGGGGGGWGASFVGREMKRLLSFVDDLTIKDLPRTGGDWVYEGLEKRVQPVTKDKGRERLVEIWGEG